MKKILTALLVVFFATSMMAQQGLTCEDPIPVDSNYQAIVDGPCELWYTAWTYDLPLNVYFLPDAENSTWGPEIEIDFTCVPGVYDDPNIESLVNSVSGFGYELPIELLCDPVIRDGRNAYDLNVGKFYRDQLTEFGINYNVQAFVRVRFSESGMVSFRPDTLFKNCMENSHYIELGDTLEIQSNDSNSVFVAALPDWKNDSIRFVWDGAEPVRMYFATTECNFTPSPTNDYVYKYYDVAAGSPLKFYTDQMKTDIDESKDGGIFYVKILAPVSGNLIVEKIPMDAPLGGATLLAYDQSVSVAANDSLALYAVPKTWKKATQFVTSTEVEMQVSNSHLFDATTSGVFVNTYLSMHVDGEHFIGLTSSEMTALVSKALGNYLYVRFVAPVAVTVTPEHWDISECLDKTQLLNPNEALYISSSSSANIYRIVYEKFEGCDMKIKWDGNGRMTTYVGDTCIFPMETTDAHVIYSKQFSRRGTSTVTSDVVNSWKNSVDEEGYLYVRFNPSTSSRVTFITEKPATPDPIYTTESAAICFGETYEWNGQTYSTAGEYTYTTVAANGADSIVTLNLTIYPEVPVTKDTAAICYGETYSWQGQEYTASGEYSVTLKNVNGCDSIVTLTLTVYPQTPATTEEVTIDFATTYEWHGVTYVESGEYTITLQDENGCDYQATLLLTVLPEPLSPCVAASIELLANDQITLNLNEAVTIYRINYEAWVEKGVELVWSGTTALHTFVAEGCEFLLSETNKHVLRYEHLLSDGAVVIDAAFLSSVAHKVDEDGFLYIRFLSVEEGTLTTVQPE